ncbi:hypothetical protein GCM10023156_58340 [Novipirellula rosea]|uniref:PDZ domain-containing protein n=2 Tax=Novipirellula rosea TaxID=1031540 RepID=A0ABP8NLM1_9BACT
MGSPAQRVGIQPGDYILAINDHTVSNPEDLKQKIASLRSSDSVNVSIWRRGKTLTKQVALAPKAAELPQSHRGWLGVMLTDDTYDHTGVVIQDVYRDSPAERAGLRDDHHIHKVNGEDVKSIDMFVDKVSDFAPGTERKLTIQREGKEQEMVVVLGQVSDAPIQWFRRSWRVPSDDLNFEMPQLRPLSGADVMDEMIDEMREQIWSLQRDVEQLKRPTPPPLDSNLEGLKDPVPATPEIDDVSRLESGALLVQYDSSRPFPPNISNDWTRSRYHNQYNGNRTYRFRPPYGPAYQNPYYYPYGNYRYYQYQGRPYYYGRSYPYGFRGGIQIGPNFGVYW